jgi:hypothetical protein
MEKHWSGWKKFPEPRRGEHLDAPVGPGLYELRCAVTGKLIAFGHSSHVATTLSQRVPSQNRWHRLFHRQAQDGVRLLEYRTLAASTTSMARDYAEIIERRRATFRSELGV